MNKKLLPFLYLAVLFTVSFVACKTADPADPIPADPDSAYMPLQKGKYITYNVDSTLWYDDLCVKLERHYQMMYLVADTFSDASGRISYRIETRIRKKIQDPWTMHDVQYVTNTGTNLEWAHSGHRFIKMIFPVKSEATWKGNAYVKTGDKDLWYFRDWTYSYANIGQPYNTGEVIYDSTVTINQADIVENDPETIPADSALRTFGKEVFAKNIGMVYREYYHWTYNPHSLSNNDTFNVDRCRQGHGVIMRAVDHN